MMMQLVRRLSYWHLQLCRTPGRLAASTTPVQCLVSLCISPSLQDRFSGSCGILADHQVASAPFVTNQWLNSLTACKIILEVRVAGRLICTLSDDGAIMAWDSGKGEEFIIFHLFIYFLKNYILCSITWISSVLCIMY
ncbi:hypothetical protein BDA96_02G253000 [Sorghum bicolor]|uniref:Uncharacterized protein n=2 Tax=Sorghum bicolor TaxID=4558 RepID=A0A1B6QD72_SORBI|nr:uncharacterized protein LOC110432952 [Sorghum bicolor]KAG0544178.1 hypothetical protein BDA96_02G253000 [Sorghum bicolor]KXG35869.1 hypothetical protein SORBI_3002G241600 [Sorghum bicolor]|eukprot:XP_021309932.1 uncharacterized protein LOC110432952 [Sorghum bicolor]